MELTKLLNSINTIQVSGIIERKDISSIVYDSRKIKKNSLFVAVTGFTTDGHKFIIDAINKGAVAVILENNKAVPEEIFIHSHVAKIVVKDSRAALAEVSDCFYKNPSSRLSLIGITGTKGKTTTSYFLKNIFETAGNKTGLVGTIANYIADRQIYTQLTTPESNDLNELFGEMINENCSHAVMEVSSHSLVLNRVKNLSFKAAVFTNITSDHLDFHKSFEEYLKAKKILFDSLADDSFVVFNKDDVSWSKLIADTKAKCFSYGKTPESDFQLENVQFDLDGTRFTIKHNGKTYNFSTKLIGEFNAYNAAASFAVSFLLGIEPEIIVEGINSTPQVPGRFETIKKKNKTVIVDYSHTADSLEKALQALRSITKNSEPVYTVFGCGGNRDKTKRPIMGKIATELSDYAIITSDNPRFEDPFEIIKEIEAGISKKNYEVIENREEAIKRAIEISEPDSAILIAGKGHENYQEIKGVRNHFSDKETAQKYL
jgi:UDP-N-acetylmuramoyl-L-alanyl-D-glutamate--2,6-diaminopimelate ligase